jgi:hypothetical protein
MGVNPSTGFEQVRPTDAEKAAWHRKYPRRRTAPYRSRCMRCGTRIWHSGIAVGSHRRACKGTFDERAAWFHWHSKLAERQARILADPAAWAAYTTWLKMTPDPLAVTPRECQRQIAALIEVPS